MPLLKNLFKKLTFLFAFFLTTACGGGGGGSTSSPVPINFTETMTATRGLVSVYTDNGAGNNPDTYAEEIGFTSELLFGGFNWSQNASTDGFTVRSDTLYLKLI